MLGAYRAKRRDRAERQDEVITLFPALGRILNRSASVLSGGEQQMVAVGRALMSRPTCLLIDEPSLGLAPIVVDEIYKTLPELLQRGMSILLVEQEVKRVLDVADRVMVLHEGKIVYGGPAQEFKDNPDALAEIYLGGHDSTTERESDGPSHAGARHLGAVSRRVLRAVSGAQASSSAFSILRTSPKAR